VTLNSFTAGSVLFTNTSSRLAQNNANLYWDVTNTRFGVGTSNPQAFMQVQGRGGQDVFDIASSSGASVFHVISGTSTASGGQVLINTTTAIGPTFANLVVDTTGLGFAQGNGIMHVGGTTGNPVKITTQIAANTAYFGTYSSHNLNFMTGNGSAQMTLQIGGNVGIGNGSPAAKLQVNGDIRVGTSGTDGCLQRFDGAALGGTCSSDERLKQNIQPMTNVLDKLVQLSPSTFNFRAAEFPQFHFGTGTQYGLIAQQVESVLPELVETNPSTTFKSVNYFMVPIYVLEGLKELNQRVQAWQANVSAVQSSTQASIQNIDALLSGSTSTFSFSTSSIVSLLQNTALPTLSVADLTVTEAAHFTGTLVVQGPVEFGIDTVGQAEIVTGGHEVHVPFSKPYQYTPVIVVTPFDYDGSWKLSSAAVDGFTISVVTTSVRDIIFNWHAFLASSSSPMIIGQTDAAAIAPSVEVPAAFATSTTSSVSLDSLPPPSTVVTSTPTSTDPTTTTTTTTTTTATTTTASEIPAPTRSFSPIPTPSPVFLTDGSAATSSSDTPVTPPADSNSTTSAE
jgi:hypothetical protein